MVTELIISEHMFVIIVYSFKNISVLVLKNKINPYKGFE